MTEQQQAAMRQALEALEQIDGAMPFPVGRNAITALRQALEQANTVTLTQTNIGIGERAMEAYEAAKQREWSGVSDERLMKMPDEPVVGTKTWFEDGKVVTQELKHSDVYKQPDDEPVACGYDETTGNCTRVNCCYTHPQEFVCSTGLCRYRKPLTDEEVQFIYADTGYNDIQMFARAIEAAHGITGEQA